MSFWESMTRIIEKQFVDRAFNLSGQHKDFYCETCRRITDHVSISHAASMKRINGRQSRPLRMFEHVVGTRRFGFLTPPLVERRDEHLVNLSVEPPDDGHNLSSAPFRPRAFAAIFDREFPAESVSPCRIFRQA